MVLGWFCSVGKWRRAPPHKSEMLLTECVEHLTALLLFLRTPGDCGEGPQGITLLHKLHGLLPDVHSAVEEALGEQSLLGDGEPSAIFIGEGVEVAGCFLAHKLLAAPEACGSLKEAEQPQQPQQQESQQQQPPPQQQQQQQKEEEQQHHKQHENATILEAIEAVQKLACTMNVVEPEEEGMPEEWRGEEWNYIDEAEERAGPDTPGSRGGPRVSAGGLPPPSPECSWRGAMDTCFAPQVSEYSADVQVRPLQVAELRRVLRNLGDPAGRVLQTVPNPQFERFAPASSSRGGTLREFLKVCTSDDMQLAGPDCLLHQARARPEASPKVHSMAHQLSRGAAPAEADTRHLLQAHSLAQQVPRVAVAAESSLDPEAAVAAGSIAAAGVSGSVAAAGATAGGQADSEDEDIECDRYVATQLPDGRIFWTPSVGLPAAALPPWLLVHKAASAMPEREGSCSQAARSHAPHEPGIAVMQ